MVNYRTIELIQNAFTSAVFNMAGAPLANEITPFVKNGENVRFKVQFVNTDPVEGEALDKYLGWVGKSISGLASISNNFKHVLPGTLNGAKTGAVTSIAITLAEADYVNPTGLLQLLNSSGQSETVAYTSFTKTDLIYVFTVDFTLAYSYALHDVCNVGNAPLAGVGPEAFDYQYKDQGLLIIDIPVENYKFYETIENERDIADCAFETQIYGSEVVDGVTYTDMIMANEFPILCLNVRQWWGIIPAPLDGNFYNKAEVYNLIQSIPTVEFSVNGTTSWHSTQVSADRFYHESRLGGAFGTAIRLPDPSATVFQYSVNGSTLWHTPYVAGDYYMHTSTDGGATYGDAILFRVDGINAYIYTAYASNSSGSGWSLTWTAGLDYFTAITSAIPLTPVAGDFAAANWMLTKGATGAAGTSVVIKGSVATVGALPGGATTGDLYVVLADGFGYVYNGATWDNVGAIQGPAGPAGKTWIGGAGDPDNGTGVDGDYYLNQTTYDVFKKTSGSWGTAALNIKGIQGLAATITIGDVTTLAPEEPATADNSGTSSEAILNLGIPGGLTGASITSAAFVSDDMVFTKDDASTVTLTGAKTTLKGAAFEYADFTPEQLAALTGPAGTAPDFISGSFTNATLSSGILTITHTQGNIQLPVGIFDNSGKNVTLDSGTVTFANNSIAVDLSVFGTIAGTWTYAMGGCGGVGAKGDKGDTGSAYVSTRYVKGNISGAVTIDKANGDYQVCTTTGTVTGITISNLATGSGMILRINNAGGYAVTWGSTVIIATTETGNYACGFYNDNGTVCFMGKGQII